MRGVWVVLLAAYLALAPVPTLAAGAPWERWRAIPGVFDVGGPRADGSIMVAGSAKLSLVDAAGNVTPFARGPGGYHEDAGAEAYMALSPGGHVGASNCDFVRDEVFLLRLHTPIGITRVDAPGEETGSFANLTGVTALNGLTFDTTGAFDQRLLVSGPSKGKTVIFAIDCLGTVKVITRTAPALEGGLAVAPTGFGSFGGALIAPDELSGKIYAIAATGTVRVVARPTLPTGGDIGVESVGFVPPGFMGRTGTVYYSDRITPKNAHPGTDSLLRLSSAQLAAAGVQDGDLLAATEGGATMVAIHCEVSCKVIPVVTTATKAHGEGHFAFTMEPASSSPSPNPSGSGPQPGPGLPPDVLVFAGQWGIPIVALAVLLALLAAIGLPALRRRKR
jgi:hypothetical protein